MHHIVDCKVCEATTIGHVVVDVVVVVLYMYTYIYIYIYICEVGLEFGKRLCGPTITNTIPITITGIYTHITVYTHNTHSISY